MARKWWTLLTVCLGLLMLLVDITIVNVALPAIAEDLGSSFADLQWVVDAYALSLASLLLTAGSLAARAEAVTAGGAAAGAAAMVRLLSSSRRMFCSERTFLTVKFRTAASWRPCWSKIPKL